MTIILYLAEAFLVAYFMRLMANRLKVPAVSGYVLGGVVLGGSLFVRIPGADAFIDAFLFSAKALANLEFVTHIALGTIAFTIGAELQWKRIKSLGASIFGIAILESFSAFTLVFLVIWAVWGDFPLALILGAVSSATAPAATVSVIQQYKARGPLTNTILAVVGMDDAISFMIFAFAVTVGKSVLGGENITVLGSILAPMAEISLSLLTGAIIGVIGARLLLKARDQESILFLLASIILGVTGIAGVLHVSELLANMACGVVIVNMYPHLIPKIRNGFSSFLPLFYAVFFIIGGAHLNIASLPVLWSISLTYFLLRTFGKISGAMLGGYLTKALPQVTRLAGLALLPQVGAAIALALVVQQEFGDGSYGESGIILADNIINILLLTTLLTEIIGPYLTKVSLMKAGEAKE